MIQQLESEEKKAEIRESVEKTFFQRRGDNMSRLVDDDKDFVTPEMRAKYEERYED
jgi:hypothetical protein